MDTFLLEPLINASCLSFFHIYIKAELPAVSARGGEITHFIMSIIVKAALEFH